MLAVRLLSRLQAQRAGATSAKRFQTIAFRGFASDASDAAAPSEEEAQQQQGVIASIPLSQVSESERLKFFPFLKETQHKIMPEGLNKRTEATFDLVGHRHAMLRENTLKVISMMKDWESAKAESTGAVVIDGERGCGKTFALQQIVQFARESEWLVLYIPRARSWCYEAPYVMPSPYIEGKFDIDTFAIDLLEKFLQCHGEQLRAVPLRGNYGDRYYPESFPAKPKEAGEFDASTLTLRDLVVNGIRDEELASTAVVDLRAELAKVTEFPVLVAIDEYNTWFEKTVFGYDGVDVKPSDIAVIDALTDVRADGLVEDRKLENGLFVLATTENFPSKVDFKKQVNYRAHRLTMRPYNHEELQSVMAYYNQVHFVHDKPTDSQLAYFRLMTKAVPLNVFDRASFA
ncbi:hypothetical protein PINS_up010199 [Pythium insidiosum]|nr:hypothetical protein PINS_up010199 [Pythium insidiosum]